MVSTNVKVFRIIKDEGPLPRSEIQRRIGSSLPTVSLAVSHLLEEDIAIIVGIAGEGTGRKAELLDFNSKKGYVLGIDLAASTMRTAVANLSGEIIHKEELPTLAYEGGPKVAERLLGLCRNSIAAAAIPKHKIRAIGVSSPGISEKVTDKNLLVPYIPNWSEVPFRSMLQQEFEVPVIVEKDVNMAIIGERTWGAGKGCENLVFLNVAVGIAAGIIIDGKIVKGQHGAAGEAGFMIVSDSMIRDTFSEEGVLEWTISGPGIIRRWREAVDALSKEGRTYDPVLAPSSQANFEAVLALAVNGDQAAKHVLDDTLTYLSMAIANIVAVVNPQKIILGGEVGLALYGFKHHLDDLLKKHVPFPPEIIHARLGSDVSVMGAIAVAVNKAIESLEAQLCS